MRTAHVIDTDTHIMEPPDLWTERLPRAWGDFVMHARWDEDTGQEMWYIGDKKVKGVWLGASYGWRSEDADAHIHRTAPVRREEAHPATYDARARVAIMDDWGVDVAVLYPNIAGLSADPFVKLPDDEIARAHVSAYNDWQLDWISAAPGRFVPMIVIPFWDVQASVAEIERLGDKGYGGVVMTGGPHLHGQPFLRDPHWYPVWAACEEAGLSVSFHVANAPVGDRERPERVALEGTDLKQVRSSTDAFFENAKQITDLLLSGILPRFPGLRFVSVESGIGWVPFVLESCDYRFKKNRAWRSHPEFGDLLPSDLFHRQVFVNFWFEELRQHHLDTIGVDNLLFETDFPHPNGVDLEALGFSGVLEDAMGHQPPDIRDKILRDNPARLYRRALEAQGVAV